MKERETLRERERESVCVRERGRERERERESVCVCVWIDPGDSCGRILPGARKGTILQEERNAHI